MHILNKLSVMENSDTEWLHNVISDILEVVLIDALLLPPLRIYQLKPNVLLKVDPLVQYQIGILVIRKSVTFIPIPEFLCKYPFQIAEIPLVSCEIRC